MLSAPTEPASVVGQVSRVAEAVRVLQVAETSPEVDPAAARFAAAAYQWSPPALDRQRRSN
jgi:hypothetical protein